jgi:hypothetical protein
LAQNIEDAFAKVGVEPPKDRKNGAGAEAAVDSGVEGDGWELVADAAAAPAPSGYNGRVRLCPITVDEIEPGLVVWLDPLILIEDRQTINSIDPPVRRQGPFICVAIEDADTSTWAGLTTTRNMRIVRAVSQERGRLLVEPEWRSGGYKRWRDVPHYLTDGANIWKGPNAVFVKASWRERSASGGRNRARVSGKGLAVIRDEIEANHRRRYRLKDLRLSHRTRAERV